MVYFHAYYIFFKLIGIKKESEGGFPPQADLMDTVDFYFQMCSCESNTAGMASIAATYANNGKSPLTHKYV
jgi:glutaminase